MMRSMRSTRAILRSMNAVALMRGRIRLASMVLVDRRPGWSGVLLGVAVMKPQIGVPFVLWMCFDRRWRHLLTAVGICAVVAPLYCGSSSTCVRQIRHLRGNPLRSGSRRGMKRLLNAGPLRRAVASFVS